MPYVNGIYKSDGQTGIKLNYGSVLTSVAYLLC